jgi:F-type H+-transporting ATPase subunit b
MKKILAVCSLILLLAAPAFAAAEEHAPELNGDYWMDQFVKFFNLSLVIGLLFFLLRKPVMAFFRTRAQQIEENLGAAARARAEAEQRLEAIKAEIDGIEAKVAESLAAARREGEAEKARIVRQAEEEAQRMLRSAEKEIENRIRAGRKELKAYAAKLAVDKAREEINRRLTEAEDAAIIDRTIARVGGGR